MYFVKTISYKHRRGVLPPSQQFLDGEKLVDGMLRRVRVAAQQANRDPDEWPGERSTFLLFPCWVVMFAKVHGYIGVG